MNALAGECFCLCEISINVNKLLIVYIYMIYIYYYMCIHIICVYVRPWSIVVTIYPLILYCTLLLLAYFFIPFLFFLYRRCCYIFCLFVNHVNIFVFGAFVYNFKNTIFIFVTLAICSLYTLTNDKSISKHKKKKKKNMPKKKLSAEWMLILFQMLFSC